MAKFKVLSTKKLEPSLVGQAEKDSIEIIEQEFISVKPILSDEKFDEVYQFLQQSYVVFTSANAVNTIDKYLHLDDSYYVVDWKIFCLSGKTKEAINKSVALPKQTIGEANNATELAKKIVESGVKEIVFFCGNKRRDELPAILKEAGITVHEMIVYETAETPTVAADDFDGILFFSPSAVESFFSLNKLNKDTVCFAIGKTTADSIADFTDNKIITSNSASQEMMLASLNFYFDNIHCYE